MNKWLVVNILVLVSLVIELADPAAPFVRVDSSPKRNTLTAKKCPGANCARFDQALSAEHLTENLFNPADDEEGEEGEGDEGSSNTHVSLVAGLWFNFIIPLSGGTDYRCEADTPLCGASRHLIRPPIPLT